MMETQDNTLDTSTRRTNHVIKTINSKKIHPIKRIIINNYTPSSTKGDKFPKLSADDAMCVIKDIETNLEVILNNAACSSQVYRDTIVSIECLLYSEKQSILNHHIPFFLKCAPRKIKSLQDFFNDEIVDVVYLDLLQENKLDQFLEKLKNCYDIYCVAVRRVVSVLSKLEKLNTALRISQALYWKQAIESFQKCVFRQNEVLSSTIHFITTSISNYRKKILSGEPIDDVITNFQRMDISNSLVYKICKMTLEIGLFFDFVEDYMVEKTLDDYSYISKELLSKLPVQDYIIAVKRIIEYEVLISEKLFQSCSCSILCYIVKETMIIKLIPDSIHIQMDILLGSMVNPYTEQLSFIYETIIDCKSNIDPLSKALGTQIKQIGHACASDTNNLDQLIPNILKLKSAVDLLVKICFNSNEVIVKNVKNSFTFFTNQQSTHIVTHLVKYLDIHMTSRKRLTENVDVISLENERLVPVCRTLTLMKYIHSKDHFQRTYQKYLARRLLSNAYISIPFEKRILKYIKTGFGAEVTHKMEGMVRDIELGLPPEGQFSDGSNDVSVHGVIYDFKLLTKSFWPHKFNMALVLPNKLEALRQKFEDNFHGKTVHKILKWNPIYSDVTIAYNGPNNQTVNIQLCLLQACIVLLFNRLDSITVSEVKKRVNVTHEYYFHRAIYTMLNFGNGYSLLDISDNNQAQTSTSTQQTNNEHTDPFTPYDLKSILTLKINLPPKTSYINLSESFYLQHDIALGYPHENINNNNNDDPNSNPQAKIYQIDSSIMRIMKSVLSMTHKPLFHNTNAKLDFELTSQLFHQRIHALVDRDFLKIRSDPEDTPYGVTYIYVP